jgi:AcrR family transcriptional regulator
MRTPRPIPDATHERTRARLLSAAGEVFADAGYRAATIRDICKRARANVAAVNYHFGDKEALYAAVLRDSYRTALDRYPPLLGVSDSAPAAQRLHAFVLSLLFRVLDQGRPAWHGKLMMRELAEASPAFAGFIEQSIQPQFELLHSIVRDVLSACAPRWKPPRTTVQRCTASIIAQCIFYKHGRPVLERMPGGVPGGRASIEELADFITQFSLSALRSLATRQPARGIGRRR